jgi:hypothetical protein
MPPPAKKRGNQVGLVFRPAGFFTFNSSAATRRSRNRFPTRDWRRLHRCHRRGTCPVNGHCHGG